MTRDTTRDTWSVSAGQSEGHPSSPTTRDIDEGHARDNEGHMERFRRSERGTPEGHTRDIATRDKRESPFRGSLVLRSQPSFSACLAAVRLLQPSARSTLFGLRAQIPDLRGSARSTPWPRFSAIGVALTASAEAELEHRLGSER